MSTFRDDIEAAMAEVCPKQPADDNEPASCLGALMSDLGWGVPGAMLGLGVVGDERVCIGCAEADALHLRGCVVALAYIAVAHSSADGELEDPEFPMGPRWSNKKAKPAPIWDQAAWSKRTAKWRWSSARHLRKKETPRREAHPKPKKRRPR